MIHYSPRAARALGYLKRAYNDLEIYVEDTANPAMWLRLIQKILPDVKLSSVNMLGGRDPVVAACKLDQADDGRKRLYIVDGDFDHVRNKKKSGLKYLYRLRAYCVENVLLDARAISEVVIDCSGVADKGLASKLLDYANLLSAHDSALKALFSVYAVACELGSGAKTAGLRVHNLLVSTPNTIALSKDKVISRARTILRSLCRDFGSVVVRELRLKYMSRAASLPISMVVSGKDYLLPLVWLHLKKACRYNGSEDQLKVLLAREFTREQEPYLVRRLQALVA